MKSYKVAVTGGIGSGKSSVLDIISKRGYKVFSADKIAAEIMAEPRLKKQIIEEFSLKTDGLGNYDRKELASKVFSDKESLRKLNELTHPQIIKRLFELLNSVGGIVFAEVPLLFESNTERLFDHALIVTRDFDSRIQAVANRDGIDTSAVIGRAKNQHSYEKKPEVEHTYINNDSSFDELELRVGEFLGEIEKKSRRV